eukprot:scaffold22453_cov19-Tisochrysis_lutea.AAC.1
MDTGSAVLKQCGEDIASGWPQHCFGLLLITNIVCVPVFIYELSDFSCLEGDGLSVISRMETQVLDACRPFVPGTTVGLY